MPDKIIYPKETTKIVTINREGYNSLSVLEANEESFKVQLYNPNVKPEEPEEAKPTAETLDS